MSTESTNSKGKIRRYVRSIADLTPRDFASITIRRIEFFSLAYKYRSMLKCLHLAKCFVQNGQQFTAETAEKIFRKALLAVSCDYDANFRLRLLLRGIEYLLIGIGKYSIPLNSKRSRKFA